MGDIKGSSLPVAQPVEQEWNKGQGWLTVEPYEVATKTAAQGKAQELIDGGYTQVRVIALNDGGKWRVEGRIPTQGEGSPEDPPVEEWGLESFAELKDLRTSPYFAVLGGVEITKITQAAEESPPASVPTQSSQELQTIANELYALWQKGQRSFYEEQPILRHTATTGSLNEVQISMSGILTIYDTADLPNGITPAVWEAIQSLPQITAPQNFYQGWLKMPTTVRQNVFSKAQIVEEWRWDVWPVNLYS